MAELAPNSVLPAQREAITLRTADGLTLVGELATPLNGEPKATIVCVHPNPTGGGMMDSHLFRKAAWRLPALADVAILRFNTRGTSSASGTSEGTYDQGGAEKFDLEAAIQFAITRGLPNIWLVGWSFGTDVVLQHGNVDPVQGAVLFSPPLKWSDDAALAGWAASGRSLTALVPELDDYLQPEQARTRFAVIPQCEVVGISECKHLWVGEKFVRIAWDETLKRIRPDMKPLTWEWDGPINRWDDLTGRLT
ncbi:MAG: alpha/beta fold hydrolase [Actinomycetes bacterium]